MTGPDRTIFYDRHVDLGAKLTEFGGWEMPLQYPTGTIRSTSRSAAHAGLFDVSHMGRFTVRGDRALEFLQHVLTENAAGARPPARRRPVHADPQRERRCGRRRLPLPVHPGRVPPRGERVQPREGLGPPAAVPDRRRRDDRRDEGRRDARAPGPASREILGELLTGGHLPEPIRNAASVAEIDGATVRVGRTGYTGEPVGFELFAGSEDGLKLWDLLVERGATPVGLGARDTLRLEAGLPLYGDELGPDEDGRTSRSCAVPLTRIGVSLTGRKGNFVGRKALTRQLEAASRIMRRDFSDAGALPRTIRHVAVTGRGIARAHARSTRTAARSGT